MSVGIGAQDSIQTMKQPLESGIESNAVRRGVEWLMSNTGDGSKFLAAPIGLYFASLRYSEKLYPVIFTVNALSRMKSQQFMGKLLVQ